MNLILKNFIMDFDNKNEAGIMKKKKEKFERITQKKLNDLNEVFEERVKLRKLRKAHNKKDYFDINS